jgi:hypothetical protein
VVNHRPLNALLLFSRLMAEKFAGTPYGKLYAGPEHGGRRVRRPDLIAPM